MIKDKSQKMNKKAQMYKLIFLCPLLAFICSCASTPPMSSRISSSVDSDQCPVSKACIYVIRPDSQNTQQLNLKVSDGMKGIGVNGSGTYLQWARTPGVVFLESRGENLIEVNFQAAAGQTYYFTQSVNNSDQNSLVSISKDQAFIYLKSCHPANKVS